MTKTSWVFWRCDSMTARDRRNELRSTTWMAAWMACWVAVDFLISRGVLARGLPAILGTLCPLALGVAMVQAYRRFLREADELLRKIHLEALALAVGVVLVGGLTDYLLARAGTLAEPDMLTVVTVMLVAYAAGVFLGTRRYA